mmetsp:Transcript_1691/g.3689  ORF Transcript_1691/g.3689 Transcript_1691/m.3689 type:complete len:215 (-) Transcript_1691:37-681(-)
MKPNRQSGSRMRSRMMPTTMSSETSPPAFMTAAALSPTSVLAETAARSMSPVESWGMPSRSSILGPCVPFPAPGGPNRIMMLRGQYVANLSSVSFTACSTFADPPKKHWAAASLRSFSSSVHRYAPTAIAAAARTGIAAARCCWEDEEEDLAAAVETERTEERDAPRGAAAAAARRSAAVEVNIVEKRSEGGGTNGGEASPEKWTVGSAGRETD